MAKHRVKKARSPDTTPTATSGDSISRPPAPISRRKIWLFRLVALIGAPLFCLGLLEVVLRLVGCGYPTTFLLPAAHKGQEVYVQNNQFGWRFFGSRMARLPEPFSISQNKPADVVRILVFGESAAKGEPQPAFGPARMLQAILSERHPGTRFEVVNAAMTAINSHTILPIARDCTQAQGDIWVIYMGNNEVVGPFGAGTVFGQQTPPLWLIRSTLALKATRIGQLLDALLAGAGPAAPDEGEWRGMKMFLDQQVRADDSRMKSVYHNFQRNLADIIHAGQGNGVGIVVSTIAVNLRDCAPFASTHRAELAASELSAWETVYQRGIQAQAAGKPKEAEQHFHEAARVDDTFAELRFRQGQCALALGQSKEARMHFAAARDLDTLRFRCDTRLNGLIRQLAGKRESDRILLADVEAAFTTESSEALPGKELFYEHVHPTFEGNFLLASTLARQVERLLPTNLVANSNVPWPSKAECARRLGWSDWSRLAVLQDVLARIKAPPFIQQVNHDTQLHELTDQVKALSPANQPPGLVAARKSVEAASVVSPNDTVLLGLLGSVQQLGGNVEAAIAARRASLELLPTDPQTWLQLGLLLVRQKKVEEAASAFQRAVELDPADALARQNLAQSLWLLGRRDEAIAEYRKALEFQPSFSVAWIKLGQALEESGRKAEAEDCYHKALTVRSSRSADLVTLARFCRSRGWSEATITNYVAAIESGPDDANLCVEAGEYLLTQKQNAEAAMLFAEAIRLSPDSARSHFLYGVVLGQQGNPVEAEQQFREALRIEPGLLEARLNLGISLMSQGRNAESLEQLEDVLRVSPTNELAARYVHKLRSGR